jgi:ribonuclease D
MADRTPHQHIVSDHELSEFCRRSQTSPFIGFDTEFVSENRYRPKLCLLQVATDREYVIIDTLAVQNIDEFWQLLVGGEHVTIAHAAREEFLFCFRAVGKRPKNLFDIQLAAGMIGYEYPAAYGNLVSRILGQPVDKGETRTDWMKRPLSNRQIEYALQDVVHLKPIFDAMTVELNRLDRGQWLSEEMNLWLSSLELSETEPQWQRVSGISSLKPRALAIVRELWIVRDEEARERNRSPKRVLADDLIVELARRGTSDPKRLKAIRGFDNRVSASILESLAAAIEAANGLPEDELPQKLPRSKTMNLGLLGQFLTTALKIVCQRENIAAGIVGSAQDIRDLAAWHMKLAPQNPKPLLAEGWRAGIIGNVIEEMLDGSVVIRVGNPKSSQPLTLQRIDGNQP